MAFTDILNNAALLLVLGIVQNLIQHQWAHNSTWGQIFRGVLFGTVAIAAMSLPVKFSPGIFFDGRSVVLSIGGLFGGPIVAVIASLIAVCYRIFLGGAGTFTGIGSILIAAGSGLLYRKIIKGQIQKLNFGRLLVFGLCVHTILIGWFATLPGGIFLDVINNIALRYLLVFPSATAILGSVILAQELRSIAEERSRIDSQKYRAVLETAPDIIMTLDQEGNIQFINHIPDWFGDSKILNEKAISFLDTAYVDLFMEKFEQVFKERQNFSGEFLIHSPNGFQRWYSASFGFMEEENSMNRVVVVAKDITRQMEDFETIQQRNREVQNIYEIGQLISSSLDIGFIYDSFYQRLSKMIPCDNLLISSYHPLQKNLKCEYCRLHGEKVTALPHQQRDLDEAGNSLQSHVVKTQHSTILHDIQEYDEPGKQAYRVEIDGKPYLLEKDFCNESPSIRSGIMVPIILNMETVGMIQVYSYKQDAYDDQELHFLQAIAAQIAVASNNAKLYEDLRLAYDKTLEGWSTALQMREKETAGHTMRVAELCMRLADRIGISEEEKVHLWRGALLHDIGKLVIPDDILHKPGPLNEEEWAVIKRHPQFAHDWLYPIEYLRPALEIPYSHHERWDGSGYPQGLKGKEIPIFARIFAVVDVFDALTSDRPYRKAWSKQKTLKYLQDQVGIQFDPEVVKIFIELISEKN